MNTGDGENSGSARVDFSNAKLPHVPAFAGLAYIFSDPIEVRGYSSLAFDINTDGKIKRIDVSVKTGNVPVKKGIGRSLVSGE